MAKDNRLLVIGNVGELLRITKQPADAFDVIFDGSAWLADGDTISTISAATFTPSGAEAPTATAFTKVNTDLGCKTRISAGAVAWNTSGVGRMKFAITTTAGEVKEVDVEITVREV